MRTQHRLLAAGLVLFLVGPTTVAAQCMRCMDYNNCREVTGGNNTDCEENPCKYTGDECDGFAAFDWDAKRIEVRDTTGALLQMEEVAPSRFAFWNCEMEVLSVADLGRDGTFHFLDPAKFRLEIIAAEDRSLKAAVVPVDES